MKKSILTLFLAIMATVELYAQQISVVSTGGSTSLYQTLKDAIEGADDGSVIYLPGGGFPIADSVKITKKLTIVGIGHKIKTENVDGYTTISGNLFFNQGSDRSALLGVYVSGNVYIGNDAKVDDVLVRYCNMNDVSVYNNCIGTTIDQNYIRGAAYFNGCSGTFSHNITRYVREINDGFISNNILTSGYYYYGTKEAINGSRNSITNNIIIHDIALSGADCFASGNMCKVDFGDDCINIGDADWNDVFQKYGSISPSSNFHFSENYSEYESKVGIYAGGSDFDKQLAPVPYIVAKRVDTETDASGKLNVKIRVKAGQ